MAIELTLDQGATFVREFEWHEPSVTPGVLGPVIDLTGWSGRMQGRRRQRPDADLLFDLTEANGGITMGGATGIVTVTITAEASAAFTWKTAFFDLLIWEADVAERLVQGRIILDPAVTVRP